MFRRRIKEWHVRWRHATQDTPDHPFSGGGRASGRTQREALDNFFNPWGVQGYTSSLWYIYDEYKAGRVQILECRAVDA